MTVEPVMMRMVPNSGPLFLPGPTLCPSAGQRYTSLTHFQHIIISLHWPICNAFGYKVYTEYCIWCIIALCTKCILVCYEKAQPTQDTVYCKCCVMALMNIVSIV